jgi:hypothetical protein
VRHRTPIRLVGGTYRGVACHIAVSEASSLFNYFNQDGNPTSHWYVLKDGSSEQYVSTAYQAPAQLEGNPTMLSFETQGGTEANCAGSWTAAQRETMAAIIAWAHNLHGFPLVAMANSRPATKGIGYHRLGINPWRVPDGELWSSANGKICPCPNRIAQIPGIITRSQQLAAGGGDDIVASMTDAELAQFLYDTNQTRINTSLTATRLDSLVNNQFPALRADVTAMRQDLYLCQVRLDNLVNIQMPDARETLDEISATLTAIDGRAGSLVTSVAAIEADADRIGDWATGPDVTGGPGV